MTDRYPYLRLITDAGNIVAGLVAGLVFVTVMLSGLRLGVVGALLLSTVLAWVTYVAAMARIESARVLLQIDDNLRELLARETAGAMPSNDRPPA